jgi:HK97 family phage portal protein
MAISQAVAGVDWTLYKQVGKERKELDSHAIINLLYKPNPFQSKREYFEALTAFALLSGNSYLEKNGPDNGPPMELYTLRPDRIQIKPDPINFVGGYIYKTSAGEKTFDPNKIMHIKLFSALSDYYGLSPIQVAGRGIDNDNAANAWNNSMLNNGARPTGAMVTEDFLQDEQYNRLKGEIDTMYKGSKNAGKPMLLEGGLKWHEMGLSPRDMDFIQSKKLSRVEICAAFGVPPEIVGDKEHATYSNYQEARQAFYQDTVLPMLDLIRDKLNAGLVPDFGDSSLYLDYDKDSIEALQENADTEAQRIREDVKAGILTVNEGRTARGYETLKNGDVLYIPGTVWVVSTDGKVVLSPKPEPAQEPPADPNAKKSEFFFDQIKMFNLESDEQKTDFWRSMDRRRNAYYKSVEEKVIARFKIERKAVIAAYHAGGSANVQVAVDLQKGEWQKLFTAINLMVMQDFGNATFNQLKNEAADLEIKLGIRDLFNVFADAVQNWIGENVAKKVVLVTETTKGMIRDVVSKGEVAGESIDEIAGRIDDLYLDQIIPNRSTVIARTEVISSSNAGNQFAAKQTELPLEKEWISTRDDRTRDAHNEVDGQKRPMDDPYEVMGESLMFPGDPKGSAKNVIQCRCTEGYSVIK